MFFVGLERQVAEKVKNEAYLPGIGVNHDHEGGSPKARPFHCTSVGLYLCDFPKCGKLGCIIYVSGNCVRAIPFYCPMK